MKQFIRRNYPFLIMVVILLSAAAALLFFRPAPEADDAPASSDEVESEAPGHVPSEPPNDMEPAPLESVGPAPADSAYQSAEPSAAPPDSPPPMEPYDPPFSAEDVESAALYRRIGASFSMRKEAVSREDVARAADMVGRIQIIGPVDVSRGGPAGGGGLYASFRLKDGSVFNCMVADWGSGARRTSAFADGSNRLEVDYVDQAALWDSLDCPEQEGRAEDEIDVWELSLVPPEARPDNPAELKYYEYDCPISADEVESLAIYDSRLHNKKEITRREDVAEVLDALDGTRVYDAGAVSAGVRQSLVMGGRSCLAFHMRDGSTVHCAYSGHFFYDGERIVVGRFGLDLEDYWSRMDYGIQEGADAEFANAALAVRAGMEPLLADE